MIKRICFFAHYDRDNMIDNYVLYYLKGLLPVVDKVIFASDSNLSKTEMDKLKGLATVAHASHHGEYDFGSWKRCLQHSEKDLHKYDELVLANDSCFAPFHLFKAVFDTMAKKNLDIWGLSKGRYGYKTYLDSYFLVLKKSLFQSVWVKTFLRSVRKQKNVFDVARFYEIGFSKKIQEKHLKWDSFIPLRFFDFMGTESFCNFAITRIGKLGFPMLKTKVLKQNIGGISNLKQKIADLNDLYPKSLYQNYIKRFCGKVDPKHYFIPVSTVKIPFIHKKILYFVGKSTENGKWYRVVIKLLGFPIFICPIWVGNKRRKVS